MAESDLSEQLQQALNELDIRQVNLFVVRLEQSKRSQVALPDLWRPTTCATRFLTDPERLAKS